MEKKIIIRMFHGSRHRKLFKNKPDAILGKLAGHVTMQINDHIYGFIYADVKKIHIFSNNKKKNCFFEKHTIDEWNELVKFKKVTNVEIPVSKEQKDYLLNFFNTNLKEPSYDYSFFGERCASTCYNLLKQVNIMQGGHYYFNAFYPGHFRRTLLKQAKKLNYKVNVRNGPPDRLWEGGNIV